ncbi:MAG: hypothetical protein NT080_05910 [Spirochaetes bacterium]|nr:hypothetical protein [Spirochaetota bacterium]
MSNWKNDPRPGRHSRPSRPALPFAIVAAVSALASACGLVDLRPIACTTRPRARNEVLPSDGAVWIEFGEEVYRPGAERRLSIESPAGAVSGDRSWDGNRLSLVPTPSWTPGVRYEFAFSGEVTAATGRTDSFDIRIPFSAGRPSGAPSVASHDPPDGASVGTDAVLWLFFSEPMDRSACERAFSISPPADCDFEWSPDSTRLVARPRKRLEPVRRYGWRLSADASAVDGAKLGAEAEGGFVTDADGVPPSVLRAAPALYSGGAWAFLSGTADLAELDVGQSAMVLFSEDVDTETVRDSVRIEPSTRGIVEAIGGRAAVFRFEETPEPGKQLELVVATSLKDRAGLPLREEFRKAFVPSTQWLRVTDIGQQGGASAHDPGDGRLLVFEAVDPNGEATFFMRFSFPFGLAERIDASARVSCEAFFPSSTLPPATVAASWPAADELVLCCSGFTESDSLAARFYRITIPGGKAGITDGNGRLMKDDLHIFIEEANP